MEHQFHRGGGNFDYRKEIYTTKKLTGDILILRKSPKCVVT